MKKNFFIILFIILKTAAFPGTDVYPGFFMTQGEMMLAGKGELLTSVILKDKGNVTTPGMENPFPAHHSIMPQGTGFDMIAVEKGFFPMRNTGTNRLKIYKALTDYAALTGMVYYSRSDGVFSKLILGSYRVQSPDDYIKTGTGKDGVPEQTVSHVEFRDNRLGLLSFRNEVTAAGDNFIITGISTGTVSRFGMTIFYPGDYRIYKFLIYDRKLKGYFFYTAQFMKIRSDILNKMDLIMPESFGNRIRAENIHFMKMLGIDRTVKLAAFR
jgi:hypothetical protein